MAAQILPVSLPPIPTTELDRTIAELDRLVLFTMAKVHLVQCYWADEHCDCRDIATVHDLKSEREFCERHFRMLEVSRG